MNRVLTELEYDGAKSPKFFDEKGKKMRRVEFWKGWETDEN